MVRKIIISLVSGLGGVVLTQLWHKFRSRITQLKYYVSHQYLGATEHDPYFGSVKILHNDTNVPNLFMSCLNLSNESERDVGSFELNIVCDPGSLILISRGTKDQSVVELQFTASFQDRLNRGDRDLLKLRSYQIPCLNRREIVRINMLVTQLNSSKPYITASCDSLGIKVSEGKYYDYKIFGEPRNSSVVLGIIISFFACLLISRYVWNYLIAVWAALIIGIFSTFFGIGLRKIAKLFLRLLS